MLNVRDFGAKGDGTQDDSKAVQHAVDQAGGGIYFPKGTYILEKSIRIMLAKSGTCSISGNAGNAKIVMKGQGPAFHFIGSHQKSALPADFNQHVWLKERMPMIEGLEITGENQDADGICLEGVMQPTIRGVLIRQCRHGIHLRIRNRNVLISDCHIYDMKGVGVFLDKVNLHQVNITGNHISYCQQGGLVIRGSEIRNIQIVGNDIEYNFVKDQENCTDVLFDCTEGTVREGSISGNTIQAKASPKGANVRFLGKADHPNAVGLLAISGNLIGSQETAIHLKSARGVVITGNSIYSGYHSALNIEDCEHIVVGSNSFDHNPEYPGNSTDAIQFSRTKNLQFTGNLVQHTKAEEVSVSASIHVEECSHVQINSSQIHGARKRAVQVVRCQNLKVADCMVTGTTLAKTYEAAIEVDNDSKSVVIQNNMVAEGSRGTILQPK